MKNHLNLLASLTLGLLVASCQNDVNEPILTDEVQNELASTRADEEGADELSASSASLTISGYRIISGTSEVTYTVSGTGVNASGYYIDWDYNTYVLTETAGGDGFGSTTITLKLSSLTSTSNTYLTVNLKSSSTGSVLYATTISIGCNGPLAGTSSVRVVRASDGLEVYPSNSSVGLRPNTYYYAYFSNSMTSSMTLDWDFDYAVLDYNAGYYAYFHTTDIGWTSLTVSGKMADSSVYKEMLDIIIYEGYDNLTGKGDEEDVEDVIDEQGRNG